MFFSKICLSCVFSLFAQQRLTFVLHIAQQIFLTFVSTQKLTDAWIAIFVVRDMSTMKLRYQLIKYPLSTGIASETGLKSNLYYTCICDPCPPCGRPCAHGQRSFLWRAWNHIWLCCFCPRWLVWPAAVFLCCFGLALGNLLISPTRSKWANNDSER